MHITKDQLIGEIVANDYRTASVFKSYGIDFCCNGNRSIREACDSKQIDPQQILNNLAEIKQTSTEGTIDFRSWSLDLLADYIEKKHHRYVEQKITEIKPYLNKIVQVHGGHHPELIEIERLFLESAGEFTAHMKKEELILFPFIRKMVAAKQKGEPLPKAHFGTVQNPVQMMKHDHTAEGERFEKIATLSDGYTTPADGCNTYRVTLAMLKEFEDDMHIHIHLENNILFPKAIEMEQNG